MKENRQNKIKEIIETQSIETQDELLNQLLQQGFSTTQATISRDIREMHLTKVPDGTGKQKYALIQNADTDVTKKYHQVLSAGILSLDYAENILVVRTVSGMAMAVAAALDAMDCHEIVGSIAGDDTIMCAVRTVEDTTALMGRLRRIMED